MADQANSSGSRRVVLRTGRTGRPGRERRCRIRLGKTTRRASRANRWSERSAKIGLKGLEGSGQLGPLGLEPSPPQHQVGCVVSRHRRIEAFEPVQSVREVCEQGLDVLQPGRAPFATRSKLPPQGRDPAFEPFTVGPAVSIMRLRRPGSRPPFGQTSDVETQLDRGEHGQRLLDPEELIVPCGQLDVPPARQPRVQPVSRLLRCRLAARDEQDHQRLWRKGNFLRIEGAPAGAGLQKLFSEPVIINGGGAPLDSTITIVQYIYQTAFIDFRLGYASALTYVLIGVVSVLSAVQLRVGGDDDA